MKREQQIRAAVKQLDGRGREEVELAIEAIMFESSQHEAAKIQQTKKIKLAFRGMLSAIRRARKWHDKLPFEFQQFKFAELKKYEENCARELLDDLSTKPKRDEFKKRLAVREAHDLLRRYGYKPTVTRHKQWYQLAAILYGQPSANLYRHLCELQKKKGPNRVSK